MRKRCRARGCTEYVGVGKSYCPQHKPYAGSWTYLSARILERDDYHCMIRLPGCTRLATTVDHIDGDVAHNHPSNLRGACRHCNTVKGGVA